MSVHSNQIIFLRFSSVMVLVSVTVKNTLVESLRTKSTALVRMKLSCESHQNPAMNTCVRKYLVLWHKVKSHIKASQENLTTTPMVHFRKKHLITGLKILWPHILNLKLFTLDSGPVLGGSEQLKFSLLFTKSVKKCWNLQPRFMGIVVFKPV